MQIVYMSIYTLYTVKFIEGIELVESKALDFPKVNAKTNFTPCYTAKRLNVDRLGVHPFECHVFVFTRC